MCPTHGMSYDFLSQVCLRRHSTLLYIYINKYIYIYYLDKYRTNWRGAPLIGPSCFAQLVRALEAQPITPLKDPNSSNGRNSNFHSRKGTISSNKSLLSSFALCSSKSFSLLQPPPPSSAVTPPFSPPPPTSKQREP